MGVGARIASDGTPPRRPQLSYPTAGERSPRFGALAACFRPTAAESNSPVTANAGSLHAGDTMKLSAAVPISLAVLVAACGMVDEIKDLTVLSQAISTKYGEQANINLAGGRLSVLFLNSKFADLPAGDRAQFARDVAEFSYQKFPRRDSLTRISVGFKSVTGAAGFTMTRSEVPYSWPVSDLKLSMDSTTSARKR